MHNFRKEDTDGKEKADGKEKEQEGFWAKGKETGS